MSVIVAVVAGCGSQSGTSGGVEKALHPVDVLAAQNELSRATARGASSARLLILTNQLLDLIHGDRDRRAQIDRALATLSGAGCPLCEAALEQARQR